MVLCNKVLQRSPTNKAAEDVSADVHVGMG